MVVRATDVVRVVSGKAEDDPILIVHADRVVARHVLAQAERVSGSKRDGKVARTSVAQIVRAIWTRLSGKNLVTDRDMSANVKSV